MNEMIERVAKAVYEAMPRGALWPEWIDLPEFEYKTSYYEVAKAVFMEMRKPTEEMLRAADKIGIDQDPADYWPAMIDEALK